MFNVRFLKVFTIYGHGGHLDQWITTILAIFRSPAQRRLHKKFEQHWPGSFREEVVCNSKHFSHTNVWDLKVKRSTSMYNHHFNNFGRLASVAQLEVPSDWRPGGHGFNPHRGQQHSFVEIDHEIFATVILSLPLIQEGQLSVSGERMCIVLVNRLED